MALEQLKAQRKDRPGLSFGREPISQLNVTLESIQLDAIILVRKVGGTDQMEAIRAAIGV